MDETGGGVVYSKPYSLLLFGLGLLSLFGALRFRIAAPSSGVATSLLFLSGVLSVMGLACVVVALLRQLRSPAAAAATVALSSCLILAFPVGTILAAYWLVKVRPIERTSASLDERSWFTYTATLYGLGLMLLIGALEWTLLRSPSDQGDLLTALFGWSLWATGLAALVIAALRSRRNGLAYWTTFLFNVALIVWLPVGTGLALVWFFKVREADKRLLIEEPREAPA